MKFFSFMILIIPLMSLTVPCRGQEAVTLGLEEAVTLALENNLGLAVSRFSPQRSETELESAKAPLDATLDASLGTSRSREPGTYSVDISGENDTYSYGMTLTDPFDTGGSWSVGWQQTRGESDSQLALYNTYYDSQLSVSFSHALLQGFGRKVNRAGITLAERGLRAAHLDLKQTMIDTISNTQLLYWGLYYARKNLEVQKSALELAHRHLVRTNAMIETGMLAAMNRLQSESGVASREEAVILAEVAADNAADELKAALNMDTSPAPIILTDDPRFVPVTMEENEAIATALANRVDIMQEQLDSQNAALQVALAQNGLRPNLDATASGRLNGTQPEFGDSVDDVLDRDGYSVTLGLRLRYPFRNRSARADLRRAEIDRRMIELSHELLRQRIRLDVRSELRMLQADAKRITATRKSLAWAEQTLAAEERKFELGKSSSFTVLQYQDDLTAARIAALSAVVDYNNSLVGLYQVLGTTIEMNGIEVDFGIEEKE